MLVGRVAPFIATLLFALAVSAQPTPPVLGQHGKDVKSVYYRSARLWVVPARVAGNWTLSISIGGELELKQRYQTVTGTLRINGRTIPLSQGLLNGAKITFMAAGARYEGVVDGGNIRGQRHVSGQVLSWRAQKY